jgi:hypothetical protein
MMPSPENLHSLYNQLTGFNLSLGYMREFAWSEFVKRKFTEDDLRFVITRLKVAIQHGTRQPGALKFSNLILDTDRFEEELNLFRSVERTRVALFKKQSDRARVLSATRRAQDAPSHGRSIAEVIAAMREAAK